MPEGLKCPHCGGGRMHVVRAGTYAKLFAGVSCTHRKRKCLDCGRVTKVVEMHRDVLEKLIERAKLADEYDNAVLRVAKERHKAILRNA